MFSIITNKLRFGTIGICNPVGRSGGLLLLSDDPTQDSKRRSDCVCRHSSLLCSSSLLWLRLGKLFYFTLLWPHFPCRLKLLSFNNHGGSNQSCRVVAERQLGNCERHDTVHCHPASARCRYCHSNTGRH